jgi:hypothetical protein
MSEPKRKKTPWAWLAVEASIGVAAFITSARQHPWIKVCLTVVWLCVGAAGSYRFWKDSRQVPIDPQGRPADSN